MNPLNKKKALLLVSGILVAYFFQGVIHNVGHPVTPDFVKGLEFPDQMFGYFFAAMNLGLVLGSPLFGYLGDKHNRKFYVVFGMFMYGVFQAAFGLITFSPYLMILFRFGSGFFVSAPATIILAEVIGRVDGKMRITVLSAMVAINTLGASIGYQLGGWIGTILNDQAIVFVLQAISNTIFTLAILLFIKFRKQTKQGTDMKKKYRFEGIKQIKFLDRKLVIFMILLMFINIAFINVSKYLDVFIVNDLGYTSSQLGTFVMVTGIVAMITNLFIVPILVRANKNAGFIKTMIVVGAISLGATFLIRQTWIMYSLYSVFLVYVMTRSVITPLEQSHIAGFAKEENYGTIMGFRQIFISIANIVGPIMGGYLYATDRYLVFWVSVVILFVAYFILELTSRWNSKHLKATTPKLI